MTKVAAIMVADFQRTRLGLASRLMDDLAGRPVLAHTLSRVARVVGVSDVILLHGQGQREQAAAAVETALVETDTAVSCVEGKLTYDDPWLYRRRVAARAWAMSSWRGGLGGGSCYDELLPTAPIADAAEAAGAEAVLLVGGDWPLVDAAYCAACIERYHSFEESMQMCFTQAPPGLAGLVVGTDLLRRMVDDRATFGAMLTYNPARPQPDPIGRDVCVQIPAAVRAAATRYVYDTPRSMRVISAVAGVLGETVHDATGEAVAAAYGDPAVREVERRLPPRAVTIEITPARNVRGPVTAHHYVELEQLRRPMSLETFRGVMASLPEPSDVALTLGGLGDAMLHPELPAMVAIARDVGVLAIAIETDLIIEEAAAVALADLDVDMVSVRLNADCDATYRQVMIGEAALDASGPASGNGSDDAVADLSATLNAEASIKAGIETSAESRDSARDVGAATPALSFETSQPDESSPITFSLQPAGSAESIQPIQPTPPAPPIQTDEPVVPASSDSSLASAPSIPSTESLQPAEADQPAPERSAAIILGDGPFSMAVAACQTLMKSIVERRERGLDPAVTWVTPRLIKTAATLGDMELFFDRWTHWAGHAVIEPMLTGAGTAPDLNLAVMSPPHRRACLQLSRRMTVHADGRVAMCDQDWRGAEPLGDQADPGNLSAAWVAQRRQLEQHEAGKWDASPLCARCNQWRRP